MAIGCGIRKDEFFHLTLKDVILNIESHNKVKEDELKLIEHQSWLNGYYVMHAIGCSMSKKNQYPKNPITEKVMTDGIELSEDEIIEEQEKLLKRLGSMATKFNNR